MINISIKFLTCVLEIKSERNFVPTGSSNPTRPVFHSNYGLIEQGDEKMKNEQLDQGSVKEQILTLMTMNIFLFTAKVEVYSKQMVITQAKQLILVLIHISWSMCIKLTHSTNRLNRWSDCFRLYQRTQRFNSHCFRKSFSGPRFSV